MMKVPPALAPDGGALLPAKPIAGEKDLESLSEARLAGAGAPHDERQAGAGPQLQSLRRADPTEPLDSNRLEECAGGCLRRPRCDRLRRGRAPRQLCFEARRAFEGCEHQNTPHLIDSAVGLEP